MGGCLDQICSYTWLPLHLFFILHLRPLQFPLTLVFGAILNSTATPTYMDCLKQLAHDRSLLAKVWSWFGAYGHDFLEWLKQPRMTRLLLAFRSNPPAF